MGGGPKVSAACPWSRVGSPLVSRLGEIIAPSHLGRPFRWLMSASWSSNIGDGIALAAGPLLVASQTRNPTLVALAALLQRLPWLLLGLWAGAIADRGEVDDHGDVLVATPGVAPDVLIDANDLHALEPRGVVDQQPLAFGQDRVVGGVPRHRETLVDPGHRQVLHDQRFQGPPQPGPGDLRPRRRRR